MIFRLFPFSVCYQCCKERLSWIALYLLLCFGTLHGPIAHTAGFYLDGIIDLFPFMKNRKISHTTAYRLHYGYQRS